MLNNPGSSPQLPCSGLQRGFRALGDHFSLMLGNGGKDMNRQLISMSVIDRYKLTPETINVAMNARLREKGRALRRRA